MEIATPEQLAALELVQHAAARLVRLAESKGVVVTIEQRPLRPLAMGNYETVPSVRLMRERASLALPAFPQPPRPSQDVTEPQRAYLSALASGRDPFANCNKQNDINGVTRTRNVLVRRRMVDSCGRLTTKGREALS